jgi:hypothetical protein
MYASLSCACVETFGGGVWGQDLFFSVQNFEIPSHHCGKLYGGLAYKAWLVVQTSLNFGGEQTMVNLIARPSYCTNKTFYTGRMKNEREMRLWRRNNHGADG